MSFLWFVCWAVTLWASINCIALNAVLMARGLPERVAGYAIFFDVLTAGGWAALIVWWFN